MNSSNVFKIKMISILLQKDYLAAQKNPAMWTLILNFYRKYKFKTDNLEKLRIRDVPLFL